MIYFVKSASHPKTVQQENDSARDDKPEEEQPEGVVAPVALFVIAGVLATVCYKFYDEPLRCILTRWFTTISR